MKNQFQKMLLTVIFFVFCQSLIFSISPNDFQTSNDSLTSQSIVIVKGTKVYKENSLLTKYDVLNILKPYPHISSKYQKGKNLRTTGTVLIVGGIVAMGAGSILAIDGLEADSDEDFDVSPDPNYYIGWATMVLGELMLDGGIACTIIGKIQIKKAINSYNTQINSAFNSKPEGLNYQLGLLENGNIGLRLIF